MNQFERLLSITKRLRNPTNGCEWDRVQTFESLKPYTLEETYELLDAIDKKDHNELKKELGDLLFHIVFYADLASDNKLFNFDDVCESIGNKLTTRHPHIFGNQIQTKPNWEQLKQKERDKKSQYSLLDDIPTSNPALMRAEKIQKRCAAVGFDWNDTLPVFDKIQEELGEVKQELNKNNLDHEKIEEEIGDLFFATANLARHLNINAEICLQKANQKFERRFKQVEKIISEKNKTLIDASLDEMESAWQHVKLLEQINEEDK